MWSQVECEYDSNNETIVFGARQIAEGDALYETSTVAVVRTEGETTRNPSVQCLNRNGKILLAVDNTCRILSNGCTMSDLFTSFECAINSFNISLDNQILIICLKDGSVHCLHIPNNGKLICSTVVPENMNEKPLTIFSTNDENSTSFIICAKINIYRLKLNNIHDIYNQINDNVDNLNVDFTFDNLNVNINPPLTCFTYEDNLFYSSNKKCFADCNKRIIALDDDGTIIAICPMTKIIFKIYNKHLFKDLMILKSINSDEHRFLVNYQTETDSYIRLLSFPNFDTVCDLKVSEHIYLVTTDDEQDEVIFIEGECNNGSKYVNELRLKVITESNHEVKLKRLLRRKCFDEAKKFARTFQLDMQQIYTAEVENYIIDNNFQIAKVDEFCTLLDNVKDIIFIVDQCLINTTANNLENIEEMLKYAYNRLKTVLQNNPDDEIFNKHRNTISSLFYKLDTFKILHCNEEFSNPEVLIDSWLHFSRVDLLEEMHKNLLNGNIDKCTILFNRLQQQDISYSEKIQNILNQIPIQTLMNYLPLLRHIILFAIQNQPDSLPIIIGWICDTTFRYSSSKSDWLEYLLQFCEQINKFLLLSKTQNLSFQKNFIPEGCLIKFRNLLNSLKELFILKSDFGIKLTMAEYMQEPLAVILILLDEVYLNKLKDFINNFGSKFCNQHRMSVDEVLSLYITNISDSQKSYWDERVICLIPFISSSSQRMKTILTVLDSSDVPWSDSVNQLAQQWSDESHPHARRVNDLKENIPFKILLKKYSIIDQPKYDNDDVILIIRRILMISKSDMLADLDVIITKYSHLKNKAQDLCFNYLVQKGKTESALLYLNNVKEEVIVNCFDSAMLFTDNFMFSNLQQYNYVTNYLEILRSLLYRLEKIVPEHEFIIYKNKVEKLKNIDVLIHKYGCTEISNINFDLSTLLPKLIESIITPTNEEKNINWLSVVNKCENLSHLLGISREECLFELEKHISTLESMIYSAENIIKSDSSAKNMCTMAVLLMKNIENNQVLENGFSHNSLSLLQINCDFNSEDITKALKLINKLAVKACAKADLQELQTACEILNWSNGCFWVNNPEENYPQSRIFSLFCPENICSLSMNSSLVIKDYFSLLLEISGCRTVLLNYSKDENVESNELEIQLLNKLNLLPDKMKKLHIEGYDLTAYQLLNVIKIELMNLNSTPGFLTKVLQKMNAILNCYVAQILDKIFVSKKIDQELAFSLFLSSDFKPLKWIPSAMKKYKMNVRKLYAASTLACSYMNLRGIRGEAFLNVKYRCKWWQKFLQHCISYNDTFQLNPEEIVSSYLLKSDKLNLKILKEFCLDFNLNMQLFLPLYLRNSLTLWKPNIEDGNISDKEKLFEKCKEIISTMEKIVVVEHLNEAWSEISYYQHEVYLCILDLFVTLEENCTNLDNRLLLTFLRDYRRIKKPQQKEIDDWQTKYPFAREIDPLSEYRLPFYVEMCTNDFWEIIRPEINLLTYNKWFDNSYYLDLDRDLICIFAIKGTVNSGVFNSKESNWSTISKHDSLLTIMEDCVGLIKNLKKATAVLYQAVRKVSGGADQVFIAKLCWKKAIQWKNSVTREANANSTETETDINRKYDEVKQKYLHCVTKNILYCYNVGTEKYLSLIENTEQLIRELYQDESIVERTKGTLMFYPDINGLVDELASYSQLEIDLVPLRSALIKEFLQKSCKIINLDETCSSPSPKQVSEVEDEGDNFCDNLKRVIYICESADTETWCNLLSNISFANLDETVSKFAISPDLSMRVKALQCLIVITKNFDELQEMINESPSSYLEKLQILLSLETLGYSLSVYELDNCNKIDLITKILRTKSSNSTIVKSLAKLCAIYNIWDSNLWNKFLQCFINLKMLTDLEEWLPKLYTYCYSPDVDCPFVCGWSCLIKNCFLKSLKERQNYTEGFLLMQMCPIVTMLDSCFMHIFDLFFENNIFEICAMFLPYVQRTENKNKILELLSSVRNLQLLEKIENLSLQGIFNTDTAIRILNNY